MYGLPLGKVWKRPLLCSTPWLHAFSFQNFGQCYYPLLSTGFGMLEASGDKNPSAPTLFRTGPCPSLHRDAQCRRFSEQVARWTCKVKSPYKSAVALCLRARGPPKISQDYRKPGLRPATFTTFQKRYFAPVNSRKMFSRRRWTAQRIGLWQIYHLSRVSACLPLSPLLHRGTRRGLDSP